MGRSLRFMRWPGAPARLGMVFAAMVALGLPALVDLVISGHAHIAGGRDVPWGVWVAAYLYFAGLSAGAFVIYSLGTVFGLERFRPLAGLALLVALAALVAGLVFITADLGRPTHAINVLLHSNPSSVMVWLVWLYTFYGALLALQLAIVLRPGWARAAARGGRWARLARLLALGFRPTPEHEETQARVLFALGLVGLLLALAMPACSGALLAVLGSRPLWHTGLFPITFVVAALAAGGTAIYVAALLCSRGGRAYRATLLSLSRVVGMLLAAELVLLTSEILIIRHGAIPVHVGVLDTITRGPYAWVFWVLQIGLGTAIPLGLIFQPRRSRALWMSGMACLLALAGGFALRLNLLIPQQAHAAIQTPAGLERWLQDFAYSPTWVEWNFVVFGVGLAGLIFIAGYRFLPLSQLAEPMEFELAIRRERLALEAEFALERI